MLIDGGALVSHHRHMLRPRTALFNLVSDDASSGGGISAMVMKHIAAADPAVAALPSVAEAIKAPVANADDAANPQVDADAAKAQADADAAKAEADAKGNSDGEDDPTDEELEIKHEDDAAKQLEKLRKAQKKVLKRLDGEVAKRKDLEIKLAEKADDEDPAPGIQGDAFPRVQTLDELTAMEQRIEQWVHYLAENSEGAVIKGADGKEQELSAKEVLSEIIYWTDVKAKQVPAKRTFLETREKTRAEAAEKFKPWIEKKSFTTAKADVEQGMKNARAILPDYEVAVQERALGRLALSGEYELVPKRKAVAAVVESATVKGKPPVPPVELPNSGGPPMKQAGSGPDLEVLKQNMLKQPGNQAAVLAFVKASIGRKAA